MENNNRMKLPSFMFFTVKKAKSKETNSINVNDSNSSEKSDDKYLSEEDKCSISAHNRTHKLFRSIKDRFKRNKFNICKGKQKVSVSENKFNHAGFDRTDCEAESKDMNILPLAPPVVPIRQKSTLLTENDSDFQNLLLSNRQLLESNQDDISLTTCSYSNYGNTSDMPFLHHYRYSVINNISLAAQAPDICQNGLPSEQTEDIFNKNAYIDILDFDSSSNLENQESLNNASFSKAFSNLTKCGYYWGPIARREAEEKLNNQPDGTFLIRDSASENHLFSLSFRSWGKTLHTRIEYSGGIYSICDQGGFLTIVELIDRTMQVSRNSVYCYSRSRTPTDPVYPVRLTLPFSRFMRIRSLRHLCRSVIRQHINKNDINKLKLPETVKDYLEEGYF